MSSSPCPTNRTRWHSLHASLCLDLLLSSQFSDPARSGGRSPTPRAQRSGSSPSCTHGDPTCCPITISTQSFPAAGLSADHQRWILYQPSNVPAAGSGIGARRSEPGSSMDCGKLHRKDQLDCCGPASDFRHLRRFEQLIEKLGSSRKRQHVHAAPPFGGP